MNRQPLNRKEAEELCESYRWLVGRRFNTDPEDTTTVECVAVAPYDDINKYIFIAQYKDCQDVAKALNLYEGEVFDVVVIAQVISERIKVLVTDLRTYLEEQKIADTTQSTETAEPA
jgi:hypothetical protein